MNEYGGVDPWIYLCIYYSRCNAPHPFPSHLWVYESHALPLRYKVINIFSVSQALIEFYELQSIFEIFLTSIIQCTEDS
jgi:hypothetical protein